MLPGNGRGCQADAYAAVMHQERQPGGGGEPAGRSSTPAPAWSRHFTAGTIADVRHSLVAQLAGSGLSGDDRDDFVLAVHELVTNAVLHGGGSGRINLYLRPDLLTCEVIDQGGSPARLPIALPEADSPGGRGLWLAHQLAAALILTRRPDGLTATVTAHLPVTENSAG